MSSYQYLKHIIPFGTESNCQLLIKEETTLLVQLVPGGPLMIKLGRLPSLANTVSRLMVSSFPTISLSRIGRYFSIHGKLECSFCFGA